MTQTLLIRIESLAFIVCAFFGHPIAAQSNCAQWDLSGTWDINQTGLPKQPRLVLKQSGSSITGNGSYHYTKEGVGIRFGTEDKRTAEIVGTITDRNFSLTVVWIHQAHGGDPAWSDTWVYEGQVRANGTIYGATFDKRSPLNRFAFDGLGKANCITATAPPRGPVGKRMTKATAKNDVDIYDKPVDDPASPRQVIGMMTAGNWGYVREYHPHGWCHLDILQPRIRGWVAQDHLTNCPP